MSKQVIWSKIVLERFIEVGNLSKFEEGIMRTRVAGWTITKQALEFNVSEATVNRTIKKLKIIYDHVQKYDPILPPRKQSAKELYMDTH